MIVWASYCLYHVLTFLQHNLVMSAGAVILLLLSSALLVRATLQHSVYTMPKVMGSLTNAIVCSGLRKSGAGFHAHGHGRKTQLAPYYLV